MISHCDSRWRGVVLAACGWLALAGLTGSAAAELVTERWRMPMRVDRQNIATSMVVEFDSELIDSDIAGFGANGDAERGPMSAFVTALTQGDVERALDLTAIPSGAARGDAETLIKTFSGMFEEVGESVRIERVAHIGPDRLLIWSIPTDGEERFYRSFRFVRDGDAGYRYEGVASEALASVLTNAFQVGQSLGPVTAPATSFEYDYLYPGTEEQPVRMRFNGTELDVNAYNPLGETGVPPVDFFSQALQALATGTAEEAAQFYTDFSEGRYIQWAAKEGAEAYDAYRSDMRRYGARVVFALDAAPMHLLFYLPTDVDVKGSPLKYAAVHGDPESGFELTNFFVQGLTDSLLQRREYFEEPFLRPLLASKGVIPARPERETVVVSSGDTNLPDPNQILLEAGMNPFSDPDAMPTDVVADTPAPPSRDWIWYLGLALFALLAAFAIFKGKSKNSKR